MNLNNLVILLLTVISCLVQGIEMPAQQHGSIAYRDFHDTPFLNDSNFLSTLISGSLNITFQEINEKNQQIRSSLETLVHEPFFRIFKLNLFKSCPFWEQEGFCLYRSCAVDTINDWADLPDIWQPEELGKLQGTPEMQRDSKSIVDGPLNGEECIDEIRDNNYCHLDGADEDCVYVDLVENPERFTGYGGEQSFQIWKLIYDENCFFNHNSIFDDAEEEQCVEKQIFYRLISGMHSSISTHLTNDYLNLETKEYEPNLLQFMFKVGNFPDRIENMYLNYILVVKSLIKLYQSKYLDNVALCAPQFKDKELELKHELKDLVEPFLSLSSTESGEVLFNEKDLFQNPDGLDLKNEFKMRFRNVSSIMDCVHCDRCRVWGKLQTIGYGTALKVLFELDEENSDKFSLEKIELIALINTFDRLSKSVLSVINFEKLFVENYTKEQLELSDKKTKEEKDHKDDFRIQSKSTTKKRKELKEFSSPKVSKLTSDGDKDSDGTFVEAFYIELGNVMEALNFIWESYFSLPRTVFDYVTVHANNYWSKFVGVKPLIELDENYFMNTLFETTHTKTD